MMSTNFKKTIATTLLIAIVFSTSFFGQAKKAEAQFGGMIGGVAGAGAKCLMGNLMGSLTGMLGGIMGGVGGMGQAVPVVDATVGQNTSAISSNTKTTATATTGSNMSECLLKGLARAAVQTLINQLTKSVIDWINGGFQGSPSFVTDPEGFFADIGDITAGQFIEGLGPIGKILCSPFDLNLRLSLGLSLGIGGPTGNYQYVGCRLSDVQKNIYNSFVGGQWGGDQGWKNFISISQGSNNAYGAYLYGKDAMSRQIASKVNAKIREAEYGSGFLSQRTCLQYDAYRNCIKQGPIQTPGTTIEAQLNKTLGLQTDQLAVAQNIDDIVKALENYAMKKLFSSGGLTGMSASSPQYGGHSYLSTLITSYQGQLSTRQTLPPAGINCSRTYRVNSNGSVDILSTGLNPTFSPTAPPITVPIGKTPSQFENQIAEGCANLAANAPAQDAIDSLIGEGGALNQDQTGSDEPIPDVLLSAGKQTSQSEPTAVLTTSERAVSGIINQYLNTNNWFYAPGSGILVNNACSGSGQYPCASMAKNLLPAGTYGFWEVDLGIPYQINKIQIYQALFGDSGNTVAQNSGPFIVKVLARDRSEVFSTTVTKVMVTDSRPVIVPLPTGGVVGQHVRIEKDGTLALGQVQVFGGKVGTAAPVGVEHSKTSITSTASINGGSKYAPTSPDEPIMISVPMTLSSTEATVPNLEAGIYLKKIVGAGMVDVSMNRIFKNNTYPTPSVLKRAITANQLNPEIIALNFASTTGVGGAINVFSADLMSGITLQPVPDNRFFLNLTNYLKDVSALTADDYATYRLTIVIYEKAAPRKPVGTMTYEFNLLSPSAP